VKVGYVSVDVGDYIHLQLDTSATTGPPDELVRIFFYESRLYNSRMDLLGGLLCRYLLKLPTWEATNIWEQH
jgi:hypothetical protein